MATGLNGSLLKGYQASAGRSDELYTDSGALREAWKYLADALDGMGLEALRQRRAEARRLLRERGVTYNVYDDPAGAERPWELDPVPLLIGSDEWARVEVELHQRAEVFNLILKDIYGPQELIRRGLLPQALVYGHPGFLRPCHPYPEELSYPLALFAVDLARGPDDRFRAVGDRTQSPSGAGYALENRVVMNRVVPSLFRESRVHRLAPFFQQFRAALAELAPWRDQDEPRVVLLTPGPRNETYFEHSFLAGYLGYTLVEGSDLTVRDGRVWLRSVRRLEPVDVILRRVDDDFCDAVELRGDSMLGVPGLMEVVRRGRVAVVNPLGAGILENPAIKAFLPAITRHFLGRDLELESVDTWWCGQSDACDYVIDNLDRMVVKTLHRRSGEEPVFGALLGNTQREQLIARIRQRPEWFVAQSDARPASAPTLVEHGLAPRPALLRAFMVARKGGYLVMPGGLARIAPELGSVQVSNQTGGLSKDVWIQATEPVRFARPATPEQSATPARAPDEPRSALPPVAAENLFWLGRYAERAETTIRALRAGLRLQRSAMHDEGVDVAVLARFELLLQQVMAIETPRGGIDGLLEFSADASLVGSLAFNLRSMLNAAAVVRDRLTPDAMRVYTLIRERLTDWRTDPMRFKRDPVGECETLLIWLAASRGLQQDGMMLGHTWRFMELGRRIEQGLLISQILREALCEPLDPLSEPALLESLLAAFESASAYRRQFAGDPRIDRVLRLVLANPNNPRSLAYQLERLLKHLAALPSDEPADRMSAENRLLLEIQTAVRLADGAELAVSRQASSVGQEVCRPGLEHLLQQSIANLQSAAVELAVVYFSDPQGPRPLSRLMPEGRDVT